MCSHTTTGRLLLSPTARATRRSSVCGMATWATLGPASTAMCGQYVLDSDLII